jgi:hypothetical protein
MRFKEVLEKNKNAFKHVGYLITSCCTDRIVPFSVQLSYLSIEGGVFCAGVVINDVAYVIELINDDFKWIGLIIAAAENTLTSIDIIDLYSEVSVCLERVEEFEYVMDLSSVIVVKNNGKVLLFFNGINAAGCIDSYIVLNAGVEFLSDLMNGWRTQEGVDDES